MNMQPNLEDFLEEDMKKQIDELLGTNGEDDELAQEYENEYEDELADEMNDVSYYGRNAGEVLEELEENLDGEESDEEDYISNNAPAIGRIGEIFAKKYLEELFKINDVNLKVKEKDKYKNKYDLEIYGNGEDYLIEVKYSTYKAQPEFDDIHFKNDFDYLFLIWHPDKKFYFAILSKDNAKEITTEIHNGRDEDNYRIRTIKIFNKEFLKELSIKLNINKELIDLNENRKEELLEEVENETEIEFGKLYEGIDKNTLYYKLGHLTTRERGKIAQHSLYKFLKQYDANAENYDEGIFDILYKNKKMEVKFVRLNTAGRFQFDHIKPDYFHFLFLIGLEIIEGKDVFYFDIERANEFKDWKIRNTGENKFYSRNGNSINLGRSDFKFGNHMTIEDIDNYIESH